MERTLNKIYIVGAGSGDGGQLSDAARAAIGRCRFFAGGRRQLTLAPPGAETFVIGADMEALRLFIAASLEQDDICVIASGDPGCFSIMPLITESFDGPIEVVPGISSVQSLSSRLKLPWQDWRLESVHGREAALAPMPAYSTPTAYFCDAQNTPQSIAGSLPRALWGRRAAVGSGLGLPGEILWEGNLGEAVSGDFPGNSLLLVHAGPETDAPEASAPGIPDEMWLREEGIPLSKSEVRAVLLSKAQPRGRKVIWDSGSGTGTYGVECAIIEPRARVYAIDKNDKACRLAAANARRFGAVVEPVCGEAPACYADLPQPDLAIIGGNDGRLEQIFGGALEALAPGGRLLVTALLEETKKKAHELFAGSGLENRNVTRVSISRGEARHWNELNPVIIFAGDKTKA